jgi:hypothetical protein
MYVQEMKDANVRLDKRVYGNIIRAWKNSNSSKARKRI